MDTERHENIKACLTSIGARLALEKEVSEASLTAGFWISTAELVRTATVTEAQLLLLVYGTLAKLGKWSEASRVQEVLLIACDMSRLAQGSFLVQDTTEGRSLLVKTTKGLRVIFSTDLNDAEVSPMCAILNQMAAAPVGGRFVLVPMERATAGFIAPSVKLGLVHTSAPDDVLCTGCAPGAMANAVLKLNQFFGGEDVV